MWFIELLHFPSEMSLSQTLIQLPKGLSPSHSSQEEQNRSVPTGDQYGGLAVACGDPPLTPTARTQREAAWWRHTSHGSQVRQKSTRVCTATVDLETGANLRKGTGPVTCIGSLFLSSSRDCLCHPDCELSHKSTHWVSPSNLSNPAGKQHIRPLTALLWLLGWEVVF